jgi:hypothetical protein
MCSTVSERLARIRQAIDELAAETREAVAPVGALDDRLARIWLMMAELDPELARRVTDYGGGPAG